MQIDHVGNSIGYEVPRSSVLDRPGCLTVWPLKPDGTEMIWGLTPATMRKRLAEGYVKVVVARGSKNPTLYYLTSGQVADIGRGELIVTGRDTHGVAEVEFRRGKANYPSTQWDHDSHQSKTGGTALLAALIPNRRFPFPKSVYAVEDALRLFVLNKPNAVVLDFFAGSGTTNHAVMRLNRQDGGHRQCISVTNNEVAADEQKALGEHGLQPGDDEWEKWGICRHITFPRIKAAITGKTPDGEPIKGDYKFTDEFPMAEGFAANLAYFKLDFLDKDRVTLKRAFREILPLLWLKAGAVGPRPELARGEPEPVVFAPAGSNFVVLLEESRLARLMTVLSERLPSPPAPFPPAGEGSISHVFIVTDSDESFKAMAAEVREVVGRANPDLQIVQLYRDYLVNFMINKRQDSAVRSGFEAGLGAQA